MTYRSAAAVAVLLVALPLWLGGSTSTGARFPPHPQFTNAQWADALAIAQSSGKVDFHTLLAATVAIGPGKVTFSNTGHLCTSGTVLNIQVTGEDPTFFVSPWRGYMPPLPPVIIGSAPEDVTAPDIVQADEITADASTGLPCLDSVRIKGVTTDPGAIFLFNNWPALLHRS